MIQAKQVEDFFECYGWNFSLASPNAWNTGFVGHQGFYSLKASLTDTYLSLEVCPLIDASFLGSRSFSLLGEKVLRTTLALNHELQVVKLALNVKGELTLSCQIINIDLDYTKFSMIVEILGYYCDELRLYFHEHLHATNLNVDLQA